MPIQQVVLCEDQFNHMLFEKWSGFFLSLKSNERLTRYSRPGKHGRLSDIIEHEKCDMYALNTKGD